MMLVEITSQSGDDEIDGSRDQFCISGLF